MKKDQMAFDNTERHAYLIMAHNNPYTLSRLLELLDDARNDIYIHVDLKSKNFPINELKNKVKASNIIFIPRKKVGWGGYSMIDAEIRLIECAANGKYMYYHLISGVDLPLKTQDYIVDFFKMPIEQSSFRLAAMKSITRALNGTISFKNLRAEVIAPKHLCAF